MTIASAPTLPIEDYGNLPHRFLNGGSMEYVKLCNEAHVPGLKLRTIVVLELYLKGLNITVT